MYMWRLMSKPGVVASLPESVVGGWLVEKGNRLGRVGRFGRPGKLQKGVPPERGDVLPGAVSGC